MLNADLICGTIKTAVRLRMSIIIISGTPQRTTGGRGSRVPEYVFCVTDLRALFCCSSCDKRAPHSLSLLLVFVFSTPPKTNSDWPCFPSMEWLA